MVALVRYSACCFMLRLPVHSFMPAQCTRHCASCTSTELKVTKIQTVVCIHRNSIREFLASSSAARTHASRFTDSRRRQRCHPCLLHRQNTSPLRPACFHHSGHRPATITHLSPSRMLLDPPLAPRDAHTRSPFDFNDHLSPNSGQR